MDAGQEVAHRRPRLDRGPVREAGGVHDAAHGLDRQVHRGQVPVRAGEAEAVADAVHEPWVLGAQRLPPQSQTLHHAGGEVLHDHVGLARQAQEERLALRVLEVEDHRLLVRVEHHQRIGLHVALPPADHIALGRLDLEHARAHEAQQEPAVRPVVDLTEVEDEHALEGAARGGCHGSLRWHVRGSCMHRLRLKPAARLNGGRPGPPARPRS